MNSIDYKLLTEMFVYIILFISILLLELKFNFKIKIYFNYPINKYDYPSIIDDINLIILSI